MKIYHLFTESHHHTRPLLQFFNEFPDDHSHGFLIFDRFDNFNMYRDINGLELHFFSRNSQLFPWLRSKTEIFDLLVIHGFLNHTLWELLLENEELRRKTVWVVFGADLLIHQYMLDDPERLAKIESIRRLILKDLHRVLTFTVTEEELVFHKYGHMNNLGRYIYCQRYDSSTKLNLSPELNSFLNSGLKTAVVGNSGDPSNNHVQVIQNLHDAGFCGQILLPVNYAARGDYIISLKDICANYFPGRYYLLTDHVKNDNYFSILSYCDYFVMGHKRQQAGQHWLYALYRGKPIYGYSNAPFAEELAKKGAYWGDIEHLDFSNEVVDRFRNNPSVYQNFCSKDISIALWRDVFNT